MRPTSPLWYLLALLLALGSWMAAAAVAAGDWDPMRTADVTPARERLPQDAGTGRIAVYTDTVQPERELTCVAFLGDEKSREPRTLADPGIELTREQDGITWHLVAVSEPGTDRAGGAVRCSMADDVVDTAAYAWAAVPDPSAARTGRGIGVLGTAVAAGLAGWTAYARHRARATAR